MIAARPDANHAAAVRALRFLLAIAAILVVAGVAAAWVLPARLDPALVRAAMQRAATERLRATVTIDGHVRFRLLPRPVLQASQVSLLHGAPGDPDGLAVTAGTLTARLDLSSLWRGRLVAANLVLDDAELQAPFPFDVRVLTAGRPAILRTTTITLEHSRVRLGPFLAEQVDARLVVDAATGDVALAGAFRLPGGSAWRGRMALSRPGGDGSAALQASLDELYAADGVTMSLTGQLAGDGGFAGRVSVAGPNLGHVLPAPQVPFAATGRASLAGGIAAFDDIALTLDGVSDRLDASLRLPPQPRLDLRLMTSRLDLDGWRRALSGGGKLTIPLSLDLTAEAATLGGGALRQLHAMMALDGPHLAVREVEVGLPGGMSVQASGTIDLTAATSQLELRLDGPDLRATAAWLGALTGLPPPSALPDTMLRTLSGRAMVETSGREIEVHDIAARLDGADLSGDALLSWPASGPSLAAILSVGRIDLAPLLAAWRGGGPIWPWPGLDAAIHLASKRATIPGVEAAALDADFAVHGDALELHRMEARGPTWRLQGSGTRSADGRWSDVAVTLAAGRAESLLPLLPSTWRDWMTRWPALAAQPLQANAQGSGTLAAPSASLSADLGALRVDVSANTAAGHLSGQVRLRHPSARALAAQLRFPADFVGDGSLSAQASGTFDGGVVATDDVLVHAGLLDASGALRLDLSAAVPSLSGRIEAPVLMLPAWDWHATAPLPLWLLHGWVADLDIAADRVEGLGRSLSRLRAHVALSGGALSLSDIVAAVPGGGTIGGRIGVDSATVPPRADAELAFADVRLVAKNWHPLDVLATGVSGTARLDGQGFAPATLLATLHGEARASSTAASVVGIDVGGLGGDLSDAAVRAALSGGRTLLDSLDISLAIDHGLATLETAGKASAGAALRATGAIDLPEGTVDLGLVVTPAITDPPPIELRLSGRADRASATPALGALAAWRAQHP